MKIIHKHKMNKKKSIIMLLFILSINSIHPVYLHAQSINETIDYLNNLFKTNSYNLPEVINGPDKSFSQIEIDSNGKIIFQEYYMDMQNKVTQKESMVGYTYIKSLASVHRVDIDTGRYRIFFKCALGTKCVTFHSKFQKDINKDEIGVTVNNTDVRDKVYKAFNHLLEITHK